MFAYIEGELTEHASTFAIVEVQGIGYQIFIPSSAIKQMPKLGKKVKLFTSFVIREFSQTLYGFITPHDRDLFEALMDVNGIGPKIALSLIGHLPLHEFQNAVIRNDIVTISKVPGIGKRTAERLIMEMRDKLPDLFSSDFSEYQLNVKDTHMGKTKDALSALIHLGYSQAKAQKALEKSLCNATEEMDLSALITMALKNL